MSVTDATELLIDLGALWKAFAKQAKIKHLNRNLNRNRIEFTWDASNGFGDVASKHMALEYGGLLGLPVRPGEREASGLGRVDQSSRIKQDAVDLIAGYHRVRGGIVQPKQFFIVTKTK